MYDAVIAGASFAGLAAAHALSGRNIAVLDRLPIGSGQTSACALPEAWVIKYGCQDSILQRHKRVCIHVGRMEHWGDILRDPYVTIDYSRFCRKMAEDIGFRFIHGRVVGALDSRVYTTSGIYRGKEMVDCTGWRRALIRGSLPGETRNLSATFGLEVEIKMKEEGLHLYFDRQLIPRGMGWVIPAGSVCRVGVADYSGSTRLLGVLSRFIARIAPGRGFEGVHGGYFPHRLLPGVDNAIWQAGDAAGQCYPYSGEGIRTALYFGEVVGELVGRVLDARVTREEAQRCYRNIIGKSALSFGFMGLAQHLHLVLPGWVSGGIWHLAATPPALNFLYRRYCHQTMRAKKELDIMEKKVIRQHASLNQ